MNSSRKRQRLVLIILVILFAVFTFSYLFLHNTGIRTRAAAGVPTLSFATSPAIINPGQNFDLIINVNPNGASFYAFELYFNYQPSLVSFQNTTNLAANIVTNYLVLRSSVDTTNNLITLVGARSGSTFGGNSNLEIGRVKMKVNANVQGIAFFTWSAGTRVGDKLPTELIDGQFPIGGPSPTPSPFPTFPPFPTSTPFPTFPPFPTDTPIPPFPTDTPFPTFPPFPTDTPFPTFPPFPTDTPIIQPGGQAGVQFLLTMPDINPTVNTLSSLNVQINLLTGGSTVVDTTSTNLVRNGNYFLTSPIVVFNNVQNQGNYQISVKTSTGLRRIFFNVILSTVNALDCTVGSDANCGDLILERNTKILNSGDSDGFNTASGSWNKVDSADLQSVSLYFNQPANGPAASADFDQDGTVGIADLDIIGKNYGLLGD